ncbi:MAG: NADPH-dependent 7-cyano-7-deazaguanine reductase QueF [Stigonema ocellatum SAG 48.90 = DSM 106950]|nr:NADPH-dependent 7-cyano-7-deazaguanine reductase QueF [Stigonema ocellatum SAG 48.90 = DSM 106950]
MNQINDSAVQQYGDLAIQHAAQELEKWPNPATSNYLIHIEHPEYTALCPRSGYPDFGTIILDYYPNQWVIELKAFKLYINSFRDKRISHEAAINQIVERFWTELQPQGLRLIGDFMRRGNIKTVITMVKGDLTFPPYQPSVL